MRNIFVKKLSSQSIYAKNLILSINTSQNDKIIPNSTIYHPY